MALVQSMHSSIATRHFISGDWNGQKGPTASTIECSLRRPCSFGGSFELGNRTQHLQSDDLLASTSSGDLQPGLRLLKGGKSLLLRRCKSKAAGLRLVASSSSSTSSSSSVAAHNASSSEASTSSGSFLEVSNVSYRPPSSESFLLNNVSFSLPKNQLGLLYGRSGSGKTTLLQVLSGLATASSGDIFLHTPPADGQLQAAEQISMPLNRAELAKRVGIVFQFPERYFLADTILEELTFGWPRKAEDAFLRQMLTMRISAALLAVGLLGVDFNSSPKSLSGGNQRRLALAIQLVRLPDLLLLDEPLAGLDWKARADVVKLLAMLKQQRSILVVSHDLKELAPLVDKSWQMTMGGVLKEEPLPELLKLEMAAGF